jgi:Ca2+-binding EF-hand superfamily protein
MPGSNLRRSHLFVLPMKRLGLTLALPPAMLFLCTALRGAETKVADPATATPVVKVEPATESTTPISRMSAAQILAQFDKNHDGKLDEDETADAHEAMMQEQKERRAKAEAAKAGGGGQRLLEMFDKNHDGRLDDEERAAARKYADEHGITLPPATREEMLKRFDKNGDGQLDDEERAEMQKAMQAMNGRGAGAILVGMRQEIVRRFDKNHDGAIDDAEWAELSPLLHERIQNTLRQLRRYDKNGDGTIDDEEWTAATAEIRSWLNETRPAAAPEKAPAPKAEKKPAPASDK